MSMEIDVRNLEISEDSALRSMEVNLAKNYIQTPVKSISTKDFFRNTIFPLNLSKLSEHFIRFDEERLRNYYYEKKTTDKINHDFAKHKRRIGPDITTLTIVEYRPKENQGRIPTEDEIKALINACYSFSDITAIPSIPRYSRFIDIDNISTFLGYINDCLNRIEIVNKKKVMGYLPMMAPAFLEILVDFYLDKGINAFYIDFDGTTLSTNLSQIETIKRTLAERDHEENSFLHYINISYGKAINDIGVLSARDLLTFGHGLDGLGGIHTGPKRGEQFYNWLREHKNVLENTTRILNRNEYGYYRYMMEADLKSIYPEDALLPIDTVVKEEKFSTKRRFFSIVNLHQQVLESNKLREITRENPDKSIDYFDSKKCVSKDDIKQMRR